MNGSGFNCDRLITLIADRTGLNIHPRDFASFQNTIQHRMAQLGLTSVDAYYQRLFTATPGYSSYGINGSEFRDHEWQSLLATLTIGESYFFRDEKQFSLLRNQVIPDLIHQRQQRGETPHLRLWSAGCSTGEEAYSLTILLREMGLIADQGIADVIGTDINTEFLAKARQGRYGHWSFRRTNETLRPQHFHREGGDQWRIQPVLKTHTQFVEFNLVQDDVAPLVARNGTFDLIVCRNVFIYFTREAIARTLSTFYTALTPGGYLITGHTELQGIPLNGFQIRCFPESIIYQRPHTSPPPFTPPPPHSPTHPPTTTLHPSPFTHPPTHPSTHPSPIHPPTHPSIPSPFTTALHRAKQCANQGDYDTARHACEEAIAAHPFAIEPCYVLASIAEETDDLDGAKVFLKRVIYLNEMAIPAYLELASLYDRTHEPERASKTRRNVLKLLEKLPPNQHVPMCDSITAEELRHIIKRQL